MYEDFQRKAEAFEFVFCRFETPSSITVDGGTERVNAELVSVTTYRLSALGRLLDGYFRQRRMVVCTKDIRLSF